MAGIITLTGCGSAAAASPNSESVGGGDKRVILKDENPDRHNNALSNLGVETSLFTNTSPTITSSETQESIKTTVDKKIIIQINEPYYLVSGENEALKSDTCPVILNGRTMVPLRLIGESLGADVNWEGKTRSVTLKKDKKEIKVQIGNNLMKINDDNNIKEVTLDAPPVVDKNGRTLVPVRAIAEGFGKTVLWDGKTNSVFIGYTEEEKNNLLIGTPETEISADVLDLNSSARASKFIAGGEFINSADDAPFAIKDKQSGAVVVFSDQDFLNIDGTLSLIERSKYSAEELRQLYIDKSIFNKIKGKLKTNDCVYILNSEAYVFNDENLKQGNKTLIKYDTYGNENTITNDKAGKFYFSRLTCDKDLGICTFDGTKITHKYNTQTKQFDELVTPEFKGTLEQRTIYNLEASYKADWANNQGTNPLGLDYQDILEFKKNGSDKNCKSFKLIKVSDNLGFICLTGGKCGLQEEKSLVNLKLAVQKCNEIDPIISQKWIERGLNFVAVSELSETVFSGGKTTWWATFCVRDYGGVIWLNEKVNPFVFSPFAMFSIIEEESNGLKYHSHILKGWGESTIDGIIYTDSQDYKKTEYRKTADKYLPSDWRDNGFGN